jgi:ribonuclease D
MHGADYDIRVLDRDYDASIHGLQDTQIMAMMLGENKTGLAALLESAFDIHLDKKYQRADWGRRPLTEGMVAYAANDTAHLQSLVKVLRGRLEALDRWEWTNEEFRRLERVRHHVVEKDSRAFERVKGVSALKGVARARAYSLFEWRDSQAQKRNIPPFKILGNASLTAMSLAVPEGPRAMGKVPGLGPRFVQRYGKEVAELLNTPLKAPEYHRPPRQPPVDAGTKKRIARLIEARDAVAEKLQIDRAVLCPRAMIEAVAGLGSGIDDGAFDDAGLTGWRREQLSAAFLTVLET